MAQTTEAASSSWENEDEEKKQEKLDCKKDEEKKPTFMAENSEAADSWKKKKEEAKPSFRFPYNVPVNKSSATTIERFSAGLQRAFSVASTPNAVAIGPYHRGSPRLSEMEQVKRAALEEFRRSASQQCEDAYQKVLSLVPSARNCYAGEQELCRPRREADFADMMFRDGWFLLQFMVSMCPDDPDARPEADPLMSRKEVHIRIDDIARDLLLLENQVPWLVLEALMGLWPVVPVDRFLRLMASAFHVGNEGVAGGTPTAARPLLERTCNQLMPAAAPHLLGLFYRHQVGAARTESLRVPRLSSMSSTAVELAEMGVKITASKTNKEFGYMSMSKRRPGLSLSGELSLAPLVLNELTGCWLVNMAAYEACLGATQADNFVVSSYISVVALLMNHKEDVRELRAKGVINSAYSDRDTLYFFKLLAPSLHVGHRYYQVFQSLQEYKQKRWVWIPVHRFFYNNIKTILAVLSLVGVLAGLFKTILSLKQPQR